MKIRQDNDVIDHICLVYVETKTELLGPIYPGAICEENQTRQQCDSSYSSVYVETKTDLLRHNELGIVCYKK